MNSQWPPLPQWLPIFRCTKFSFSTPRRAMEVAPAKNACGMWRTWRMRRVEMKRGSDGKSRWFGVPWVVGNLRKPLKNFEGTWKNHGDWKIFGFGRIFLASMLNLMAILYGDILGYSRRYIAHGTCVLGKHLQWPWLSKGARGYHISDTLKMGNMGRTPSTHRYHWETWEVPSRWQTKLCISSLFLPYNHTYNFHL